MEKDNIGKFFWVKEYKSAIKAGSLYGAANSIRTRCIERLGGEWKITCDTKGNRIGLCCTKAK